MAHTDYRSKLEQQAIEHLEQEIKKLRQMNRGEYIHYMTLGISDIERLLYYVNNLEHELAYRDAITGAPAWFKE